MADRIQLTKDIYMPIGHQWSIVLAGSVIDVPDAGKFSPGHVTVLAEAPATLIKGKSTPVRNVIKR